MTCCEESPRGKDSDKWRLVGIPDLETFLLNRLAGLAERLSDTEITEFDYESRFEVFLSAFPSDRDNSSEERKPTFGAFELALYGLNWRHWTLYQARRPMYQGSTDSVSADRKFERIMTGLRLWKSSEHLEAALH